MIANIHKENTLLYNSIPSPFIIKKAEELRMQIATIPHRHSYYVILWSFNNVGRHLVDTHYYPFRPQNIWFVPPGVIHCIEPPQPQGLMLQFIPELFFEKSANDGLLSKLDLFRSPGAPLSLSEECTSILMKHAVAMSDAFFSSDYFRMEKIKAHLKLFLIECNEQWLLQQKKDIKDEQRNHPAATTFKKLVSLHLHDWHDVDHYARELCLSSHYLSELLKEAIGESPKKYISSQLTIEAKRLALFSDLSAKEISFSLGFDTPAGFSRFFKEQTGLSFQAFRQTIL
jgi:AraC family transcriptional regulator, transcriptional activator of pobA